MWEALYCLFVILVVIYAHVRCAAAMEPCDVRMVACATAVSDVFAHKVPTLFPADHPTAFAPPALSVFHKADISDRLTLAHARGHRNILCAYTQDVHLLLFSPFDVAPLPVLVPMSYALAIPRSWAYQITQPTTYLVVTHHTPLSLLWP